MMGAQKEKTVIHMHSVTEDVLEQFIMDASRTEVEMSDAIIKGIYALRLRESVATSCYIRAAYLHKGRFDIKPLCMFGVVHVQGAVWAPWYMHTRWAETSYVYAKTLFQMTPVYLGILDGVVMQGHMARFKSLATRPTMENYIWEKNISALRFVEGLGFEVDDAVQCGTEGNYFHRVWRTL